MDRSKLLGALLAVGLIAGCTSDIQQAKEMEGTGSPFTQALTEEYKSIVIFEADEMYDWPDADYFAEKGLTAASGQVVQPEEMSNWKLPPVSS